tara:strand:+ start:74155 stop:74823 length:669 start_codon:yes stop_codon:yes gene_type:complete
MGKPNKYEISKLIKAINNIKTSDELIILGASKSQDLEAIDIAYQAGIKHFGENYLQEAEKKIEKANQNIVWHFIGSIQSNKVKRIASLFQWVHSLENINIAKKLDKYRPPDLGLLNACVQINVDKEDSKSGISIESAYEIIQKAQTLKNLKIRGIMAIPAQRNNLSDQRRAFSKIKNDFLRLQKEFPNLDTLSMGMSQDYEAALKEDATIIRLGTLIFGKRE